MPRICKRRSKRIVHANPDRAAGRRTGHIFLVRADLLGPEGRDASARRWRASILARRRGSLERAADSRPSAPGCKRPRSAHAPPRLARTPASAGALPNPPIAVLQRLWRFQRRRPRICRGDATAARQRRRPGSMSSPIPDFGFQVSAEGAGFCWAANSQQNQITPGRTIRSPMSRAMSFI